MYHQALHKNVFLVAVIVEESKWQDWLKKHLTGGKHRKICMLFEVKLQFVKSSNHFYSCTLWWWVSMPMSTICQQKAGFVIWWNFTIERQISVPYGVGLFMLGFYLYKNYMPTSLSFLVKNIVHISKCSLDMKGI